MRIKVASDIAVYPEIKPSGQFYSRSQLFWENQVCNAYNVWQATIRMALVALEGYPASRPSFLIQYQLDLVRRD